MNESLFDGESEFSVSNEMSYLGLMFSCTNPGSENIGQASIQSYLCTLHLLL